MTTTTIWRARCGGGHCDIRTTGYKPRSEMACKTCRTLLPWEAWEVSERPEWLCGNGAIFADRRSAMAYPCRGQVKRVVRRTLRRVKP